MDRIFLELKENLIRKQEALSGILEIAQQQEKLLEADDIESLAKGMDKRQKLIDSIERLDTQREPLLQLFKIKDKNALNANAAAEIGHLGSNILITLKCIQKLDSVNTAAAAAKLEEYKKQVKSARLSSKRFSSYSHPYTADDGIFIDAKK